MPVAESVSLRVKLSLPDEVVAHYEQKSRDQGVSLEALIARKLTDTVQWTSQRPIYVNDQERKDLERQLGHNIGSGKQLVEAIGKLARIRFGTVDVNLNENVLVRLRSRCPRMEQFESFLRRNVTELIEQ